MLCYWLVSFPDQKCGLEMRLVNRSIAWPYAVFCMIVLSQPCSQAPRPASHRWKVRLVLCGGGTSCPGRGHLVLGPHVQGDSWSGGTHGPPTLCSFSECVKSFLLCILFGWFLSVPSLHALVFIWKTSLWLVPAVFVFFNCFFFF